ncbi:MAG: hypothetical protein H7255_10215 [Ramlibacter sp.]|nr:hypothetical protein [Ramlibacter sp.]
MNIERRILQALRPRRDGVLLRSDVSGFGSPSQVSAALVALQEKQLIQKLRHGIYAKPALVAQLGPEVLLSSALVRLKAFRAKRAAVVTRAKFTPTSRRVQQLAKRERVKFVPTFTDRWATAVTRMAGDDVASDATDDLLVALRRAGKVSPTEMATLVMAHHRERRRV